MKDPTEIIVYRNPGEKLLWDSVLNGYAFPVLAAVVVFFVCLFSLTYRHEMINRDTPFYVRHAVALSSVVAIAACYGAGALGNLW